MNTIQPPSSHEHSHEPKEFVGHVIAKIRHAAGLTQADLAKRLTYSPVKISRIESGGAEVSTVELSEILTAIDTPLAREFGDFQSQLWSSLARPRFDHPNRGELWEAELMLRRIDDLLSDPNLKNAFVEQLKLYKDEVLRVAGYLASTTHSLAFIGSIGIGKTTAICSLASLRLPAKPSGSGPVILAKQMALEAGGGGTTICEVRAVFGSRLGIVVEPKSDDEIRADVADFSEYLMQSVKEGKSQASNDEVGTSAEIACAIRNMSGLITGKITLENGKKKTIDPAKDLARSAGNVQQLTIEILTRMNLPRRQTRTLWLPSETKLSDMEWLQKSFADINKGKNPECPMPRLIEVVLPTPIFGCEEFDIKLIDTKGIDQSGHREDLQCHFDDPRTVLALCSGFKDAPSQPIQDIIQRVKDAGASDAMRRTALLVLPQPTEAMSIKDSNGDMVDGDQEGYEIKRDHQIDVALTRLGVPEVSVLFFNASYEDFDPIRSQLIDRIRSLRASYSDRLFVLRETIDQLYNNMDEAESQAVIDKAVHDIQIWLDNRGQLDDIQDKVDAYLVSKIGSTHARSIWASVRRNGVWSQLDYYYQIGFGARTIAAKHIEKKIIDLSVIIENMLDDEDRAPAHAVLEQIRRDIKDQLSVFLQRIELTARAEFEEDLKDDAEFWNKCDALWGTGSGYRERVASNSRDWFDDDVQKNKSYEIAKLIIQTWEDIVDRLRDTISRVSTSG